MSAIIQEYTYEDETHHLDDDEALEVYKREKALHPDAIIVLDDLHCGHWDVSVYKTPGEKETLLRKKWSEMFSDFLSSFKR